MQTIAEDKITADAMMDFPSCSESERSVISCVMNDWSLMEEGELKGLKAEVFYRPLNRWLWVYFLRLREEGRLGASPVMDISMLYECLSTDEYWSQKDIGISVVVEIMNHNASGVNFAHFAERVVAAWRLREVFTLGAKAQKMAMKGVDHVEVGDILDELSAGVTRLDGAGLATAGESMKEVVPRLMDNFVERVSGRGDSTVVLSPWANIGIGRGRMLVVGARPGMGKSAFLWGWAQWLGEREPVGILTLEMHADEFVGRALTGTVGVNILETTEANWKRRDSQEQQEILGRLKARGAEMMARDIVVDWCPGANHHRVCQSMRVMARRHGVKVFFFDYLQKIAPASRQEITPKMRVDNALAAILTCAQRLGVTLIMAVQSDRECDKLAAVEMRMSHLSDTSQTEKDADAILYLGWAEAPKEGEDLMDDGWKKRAAHYAKFRGGKPGTRAMAFSGSRMEWKRRRDVSESHED